MVMLERIPSSEELSAFIGLELSSAWRAVCGLIDDLYGIPGEWNSGGKRWTYEYKYRRGGKTLCALYARESCAGLLIIFGSAEREKVEMIRTSLSPEVFEAYESATTYHDGKWVMFPLSDLLLPDYTRLLAVKRKPRKSED